MHDCCEVLSQPPVGPWSLEIQDGTSIFCAEVCYTTIGAEAYFQWTITYVAEALARAGKVAKAVDLGAVVAVEREVVGTVEVGGSEAAAMVVMAVAVMVEGVAGWGTVAVGDELQAG